MHEPLGVASTAHVGQHGDDVTAGRRDLGLRLFKRVLIAHRGKRQPRALPGEGARDREADSPAAAGNDRDLILESALNSHRRALFLEILIMLESI